MQIVSVTQKGQVTIPKKMRDKLGIKTNNKVIIKQAKDHIKILPPEPDLVDLAGTFVPRANKGKSALKAREYMQRHYERV